MSFRSLVVLLLTVLLGHAEATETLVVQGGYSTELLSEAVFDPAYVVVDSTRFNNWLNTNHNGLNNEAEKDAREHLYYLIDSWVASINARGKIVLPDKPDGILSMLFSWADQLGVFGGDLIFRKIKSAGFPEKPARMSVPAAFELSLDRDMLEVGSKTGHWTVRFPYYFMLWMMHKFVATDGPEKEVIGVSTSAARHANGQGYSQATLMLLYGPTAQNKSFSSYWSKQYGFTGDEPAKNLGIRTLTTRSRHDLQSDMYYEYTSWDSSDKEFFVVYVGINGPYQRNRASYIDFVKSIRTP